MRIRAVLTLEYEVDPDHYGTDDPVTMVNLDMVTDPEYFLDQAWSVEATEVIPA